MHLLKFIENNNKSNLYDCGVYKIYHEYNPSIIYIGSTSRTTNKKYQSGFYNRWKSHLNLLKNSKHNSKYLQNIVNKYGIEGIRFAIVEVVECLDNCIRREQFYIDFLSPKLNTVLSAGSTRGYKHTQEDIDLMKRQRKGRKLSETQKQNISKALKGKIPKNIHLLRTKEVRDKVIKKAKGRPLSPNAYKAIEKCIYQFDILENMIKKYKSGAQASRETNIDRGSINNCALGNRKSAGGFLWLFTEKFIIPKIK